MSRHRILLQTNPCFLKTGLAEHARSLLKYLWKTDKYDIAHMCTQGTLTNDPRLNLTPWKSYGCIPPDQELVNRINSDPVFGRAASYGSVNIDAVVRDFKPTIWIGSDDLWAFSLADYMDKPWYKRIHAIPHITVDSIPVLDQAYEQAKRSKHFFTWAKFAATEMKRVGGASMAHVSSIYGAMDIGDFSPVSEAERTALRKQFNIDPDTFIFLFVFRNQLRKSASRVLEAYARFRRENPNIKAALHFHTSFSEKGQGWDLPKMASYYGVDAKELLATYVCRNCGVWLGHPFVGEDIKCQACGTDKALITASIVNGVPSAQMKFVYGLGDACLSVFSSGGQEYHSVQSLLCGKPLACTNYSCGEDFCIPETSGFVTSIGWSPYDEAGTNFVKAANNVGDIAAFMRTMARASKRDLQEAGEQGRDWATRSFGIETIGSQWERLFETLNPNLDWSSIDLTSAPQKDPNFVVPDMPDNVAWLKALYKGILLMEVSDGDEGLNHWISKLSAGVPRTQIDAYFRQVAHQENAKTGAQASVDFGSLLDNTGHKRGLLVIKQSAGDVAMVTSLFESFHQQYPDTDLYVATDPQYHEILAGNEHVHKVLAYMPAMENELLMIGQGKGPRYFSVYMHPGVVTQRQLMYLSQNEGALDLVLKT